MKGHPNAGEPTNFKELYLSGVKIHTIRAGEYWRKVVEEVNAGRAILSVREWSGKPYASKQVEIGKHEKLGWQPLEMCSKSPISHTMAKNDGLKIFDFINWFGLWGTSKKFKGGIIHFTDFRYA